MKYIVELGTTDGYIFEGEDVFEFSCTEQEKAVKKYESLIVEKYQYKAMYEEENNKKSTIRYDTHETSNLSAKEMSTYFVVYAHVDDNGKIQLYNSCFEIDKDSNPMEMIEKLKQMCNQEIGVKCIIINYKRL
ncbi:MAG: hypothetical protein RSC93_03190 [Erysipelotrichaceae bacterium]